MSFGRQARWWNEWMCSEIETVRSLSLDFMLRRVENRARRGRRQENGVGAFSPRMVGHARSAGWAGE